MAEQLNLLEADNGHYRLDERTKESGRRGIALARQALTEASQSFRSLDPRPVAELNTRRRSTAPAPTTEAPGRPAHAA